MGTLLRETTIPFSFLPPWVNSEEQIFSPKCMLFPLTLLHSERPKLYTILAFLSAVGLTYNAALQNNYFMAPKQNWLSGESSVKG